MSDNLAHLIPFLKGLAANNNREYFTAHKSEYNLCRESFDRAVERVILACASLDEGIKHLSVKDCVYRINRDIRFSPDKSPYKRHFGAYIAPKGGRKSLMAGYYLHIEPEASMLYGGLYCLPTNLLRMVRDAIYYSCEPLEKILSDNTFHNLFGDIYPFESLRRVPNGYDPSFRHAEWLKFKNFNVSHSYTDEEVAEDGFIDKVIEHCAILTPYNQYFNEILVDEL